MRQNFSTVSGCISETMQDIEGRIFFSYVYLVFSLGCTAKPTLDVQTSKQRGKNLALDRGAPWRQGPSPMVQPAQWLIRPWRHTFSMLHKCSGQCSGNMYRLCCSCLPCVARWVFLIVLSRARHDSAALSIAKQQHALLLRKSTRE